MPKTVDKEEMKKGIIDAALRVYLNKGYHHATIADIAEEASLGKGTIYLYYKNKEALAVSMMHSHFDSMEGRFFGEPEPDTLETFAKSLKKTMKLPDDDARWIRLFFEVFGPKFESDEFANQMASFFDRLGQHYADRFAKLQAAGQMRQDADPKYLGRTLACIVDGLIVHRGLFTIPESRHAKLRLEFAEVFVRGLAA